jgi:hypothetical protein
MAYLVRVAPAVGAALLSACGGSRPPTGARLAVQPTNGISGHGLDDHGCNVPSRVSNRTGVPAMKGSLRIDRRQINNRRPAIYNATRLTTAAQGLGPGWRHSVTRENTCEKSQAP